MRLFVLLLLLNLSVSAQKKWTHISGNDIVVYSCMAISGTADGVNQAIVHHEFGRASKFWDFQTSYKNKYRNMDKGDERAAFFGSKSIFVAFTDGFHLSRFVDRSFTLAAVCFSSSELKQYQKKDRWKVIAKKALISTLLNRVAFDLTYSKLWGPFK